jgi:hypothetical protein
MSSSSFDNYENNIMEYFHDMLKTLEGETKKHGLNDANYFLSLARKTLEEKEVIQKDGVAPVGEDNILH